MSEQGSLRIVAYLMYMISLAVVAGLSIFATSIVHINRVVDIEAGYLQEKQEVINSYNGIMKQKDEKLAQARQEIQELSLHIDQIATLRPVLDLLGPNDIKMIVELLKPGSPFDSSFRVTSRFGEGRGYQGNLRMGHLGNDLVPNGDWYVHPMWDGIVVDIGIDKYLGKYIVIEHDELIRTRVGHLETIFFTALPGEAVTPETVIGVMGSTGYSDGAHLHLELQIFDGTHWVTVDIYPWLKR